MIWQVRIAGGKASVGDGEILDVVAPEPAAAAKLLINAKAGAGGIGDIGRTAFDPIGRCAQLDEARRAKLSKRELTEELRSLFPVEFGGGPEQPLGADLAPVVEAVFRSHLIGGPPVFVAVLLPGTGRANRRQVRRFSKPGNSHSSAPFRNWRMLPLSDEIAQNHLGIMPRRTAEVLMGQR